jgi:hypothetical protein
MADLRAPREERSLPGFVLGFLVDQHPALYSIDELDRMLASPEEDRAQERLLLEEAIKTLVGDGLEHGATKYSANENCYVTDSFPNNTESLRGFMVNSSSASWTFVNKSAY